MPYRRGELATLSRQNYYRPNVTKTLKCSAITNTVILCNYGCDRILNPNTRFTHPKSGDLDLVRFERNFHFDLIWYLVYVD